MRKAFMVFGLGIFIFASMLLFKSPTGSQEAISQEYVPGELLVKFKPKVGKQVAISVLDTIKPKVVNYLGQEMSFTDWNPELRARSSFLGDTYLVYLRVPETIGTEKAIEILKNNPNVEYAEPNYVIRLDGIPNDEYFQFQWGLHNTGQTGGQVDEDIDAVEAWDIFTGSQDVVVAVIDSGIDYNHEDLAQNIWINTGEIPNNGADDDGNGYVDDYRGWNFYDNNNNPMDLHGHGTHVAGIIGAVGNNGIGVTGVCWNVRLMALKVVKPNGMSDISSCIRAIDYAIGMGAKVINASWGPSDYSDSLSHAICRAQGAGQLFVAASGNNERNIDLVPYYPASYDHDNIISVSSIEHNGEMSEFSNYGVYSVDLAAPGGTDMTQNSYNILSTYVDPNNTNIHYYYSRGTSMATPFVSGVAALLLGQRPEIDWWQAKTIILKTVDIKPQLQGKVRTSGRLNAYKSLICPTPILPAAPSDLHGTALKNGYFYDIRLTWKDNSNNESGFAIYLKSGSVFYLIDQVPQNVTTCWLFEFGPGYYCFYIRAFNADGESIKTPQIAVKALG